MYWQPCFHVSAIIDERRKCYAQKKMVWTFSKLKHFVPLAASDWSWRESKNQHQTSRLLWCWRVGVCLEIAVNQAVSQWEQWSTYRTLVSCLLSPTCSEVSIFLVRVGQDSRWKRVKHLYSLLRLLKRHCHEIFVKLEKPKDVLISDNLQTMILFLIKVVYKWAEAILLLSLAKDDAVK